MSDCFIDYLLFKKCFVKNLKFHFNESNADYITINKMFVKKEIKNARRRKRLNKLI